jgi:DNA-binding XRE family transcriptional regulator
MMGVKLQSGIEFLAKVQGQDLPKFTEWIGRTPGVSGCEEVGAVNRIGPHSNCTTKIARARMAAGLTQQGLADMLGVHIHQYQRWEYGIHRIKAEDLKRIGEALNVDWSTLIEDK